MRGIAASDKIGKRETSGALERLGHRALGRHHLINMARILAFTLSEKVRH